MRNQPSSLCLDTLQKDEKTVFDMGMFYCQNGGSSNQVSEIILVFVSHSSVVIQHSLHPLPAKLLFIFSGVCVLELTLSVFCIDQ